MGINSLFPNSANCSVLSQDVSRDHCSVQILAKYRKSPVRASELCGACNCSAVKQRPLSKPGVLRQRGDSPEHGRTNSREGLILQHKARAFTLTFLVPSWGNLVCWYENDRQDAKRHAFFTNKSWQTTNWFMLGSLQREAKKRKLDFFSEFFSFNKLRPLVFICRTTHKKVIGSPRLLEIPRCQSSFGQSVSLGFHGPVSVFLNSFSQPWQKVGINVLHSHQKATWVLGLRRWADTACLAVVTSGGASGQILALLTRKAWI